MSPALNSAQTWRDVNDFHRRSAFARLLREEPSRRLDCRFGRAQHDDSPAHFCCRSSQRNIRADDRHRLTVDIGHRGPERAARENDSVGIGCQRKQPLVCLGAQFVGKRPRSVDGLAKVRSHFMVKFFGPQSKRFCCLLKHLAVPIHRMQKRNTHCRMPRYQVCYVDAASYFHAGGRPDRFRCIVATSVRANKASARTGIAGTSFTRAIRGDIAALWSVVPRIRDDR